VARSGTGRGFVFGVVGLERPVPEVDWSGMRRARTEQTRRAVFVMGAMAVAGVLIWSKLRLATNIPRSAYAVPEQVEPADRAVTGEAGPAGSDPTGAVPGPAGK
jgi:hypothetical protein